MKLVVDCQYLNAAPPVDQTAQERQKSIRAAEKLFADWRREEHDELIFAALERGGAQQLQVWPLAHPAAALLDAGPMCSLAWTDFCFGADWLIVPFPLLPQTLLPGSAPCQIAALLGAADLQLLRQTPLQPDPNLSGRNTPANRLQVIAQYECLICLEPLPPDFTPPQPFEKNRFHCALPEPQALRNILEQRVRPVAKPAAAEAQKPQLAFFTPLRPQRTGIADYNETLLLHLQKEFAITLFLDRFEPSNAELAGQCAIRQQADYTRWSAEHPAAQTVFVLGNNNYHKNIFAWSQRRAGIVELHEIVPLAYGIHAGNHWSNRKEWDALVAAEHGLNLDRMRRREFAEGMTFDLQPMTKTLLKNARAAIVHNQWCAEQVRRACPGLPVADTGHGLRIPPPPAAGENRGAEFRRKFGIADGQVLFIVLGEINPFKRHAAIVRAWSIAAAARNDLRLIFAGGSDDPMMLQSLANTLERFGLQHEIQIAGYLSGAEFEQALHACDVAINLRWPTFGEASGAITRLMGAAKPVIVTAKNQFLEYPDEACWKIAPGETEPFVLAEAMLALAGSAALRRQIGRNARSYIERFSWENVARKYAEFLRELRNSPIKPV